MKQTAVKWLEEEIQRCFLPAQKHYFNWAFQQAKEMEKQQMKNAVLAQSTNHEGLRKIFDKQFEEYYNETFNK